MKQPGIVYPAQKIFFLFMTLMTMNFIQRHERIKFLTIAKKRSSNEHTVMM